MRAFFNNYLDNLLHVHDLSITESNGTTLEANLQEEKIENRPRAFLTDWIQRKPQYAPAYEVPLNLFHVEYPDDGFEWVFDEEHSQKLCQSIARQWTEESCKTAMLYDIMHEIKKLTPTTLEWPRSSLKGGSKGKHHPLMGRQKGETLEERIQHFVKKRKLAIVKDEHDNTCVVKVPKLRIDIGNDASGIGRDDIGSGEMKSALNALCDTLDKVIEKKESEDLDSCSKSGDISSGAADACREASH